MPFSTLLRTFTAQLAHLLCFTFSVALPSPPSPLSRSSLRPELAKLHESFPRTPSQKNLHIFVVAIRGIAWPSPPPVAVLLAPSCIQMCWRWSSAKSSSSRQRRSWAGEHLPAVAGRPMPPACLSLKGLPARTGQHKCYSHKDSHKDTRPSLDASDVRLWCLICRQLAIDYADKRPLVLGVRIRHMLSLLWRRACCATTNQSTAPEIVHSD